MRHTTTFVALSLTLALGAGVAASLAAQAQDNPGKASAPLMTLTPLDYVEIRQLAARYGHAVDQGAAEGYAYADLFAEGATCLEDTDCNYGLACLGSPGVCTIVPHLGEPCPDEVCGDLGTYCATDGTCHATGLVGASCMTSQECSPFYPCNGTQCGSLPKLGETCSGLCSDGSYCDSTTLQCTARQTNGATCTGDFQCESNYCKATCQDPQACG